MNIVRIFRICLQNDKMIIIYLQYITVWTSNCCIDNRDNRFFFFFFFLKRCFGDFVYETVQAQFRVIIPFALWVF